VSDTITREQRSEMQAAIDKAIAFLSRAKDASDPWCYLWDAGTAIGEAKWAILPPETPDNVQKGHL
jgi:hypothetical protein